MGKTRDPRRILHGSVTNYGPCPTCLGSAVGIAPSYVAFLCECWRTERLFSSYSYGWRRWWEDHLQWRAVVG